MRISGRLVVAISMAVALLAVALGAAVELGGPHPHAPAAPAASPAAGPAAGPALRSLGVLGAWDRQRARAWARGDTAALARLYVPGSGAGRRDVAMLRRWTSRGLRVRGMRMQVLGVRLESRSARRVVLVVTDRLSGAYAVGHGRRYDLPRDDATRHRVVFVRRLGRWLVESVRT